MNTVARQTDERGQPELLVGTFRCKEYNGVVGDVEQQFGYTEVGLLSTRLLRLLSATAQRMPASAVRQQECM